MDDQLLSLFTSLNSQLGVRSKFITLRMTETNHLEFKEKADTRVPDLGPSDRKNFAKTLSSFSNAEGGLLIWGVRTRRRDGRDYAAVLKPIIQAEVFAERLRSSLIDVLMPQNPGIRIEAIVNRVGNGFVKCLIPESPNPPHRSMVDREYWVRLDGRSVRMEHYLIRDMMSRRSHPDLEMDVIHEWHEVEELGPRLDVSFVLENTGTALAKYAGWVATLRNVKALDCGPGVHDMTRLNNGRSIVGWNAQSATVIHPNPITVHVGRVYLLPEEPAGQVVIDVSWYCEDMNSKSRQFTISANTLEGHKGEGGKLGGQ